MVEDWKSSIYDRWRLELIDFAEVQRVSQNTLRARSVIISQLRSPACKTASCHCSMPVVLDILACNLPNTKLRMAGGVPTLGKRKRSSQNHAPKEPSPQGSSSSNDDNHEDIFRKAFEARFMPLEVSRARPKGIELVDEIHVPSEEDSDWDGFASEPEEPEMLQVIDHSKAEQSDALSRAEQKAYMVSVILVCKLHR